MNILGIESSCDETAAAVIKDGRTILSNVVASQVDEHKLYGGVVPEIASRRHCENVWGVCEQAVLQAGLQYSDIDAVAVTFAPGLIGALLVGLNFAKGLATSLNIPLIPVHHLRGHIASNYISFPELEPPFLCLVVSGGNSQIIEVKSYTEFKTLGKTRDDAAGEAFDKTARAMGLSYPGGINLDKIAEKGDPHAFKFPRPKVDGAPMDFSFSGLKTAVLNTIHNMEQREEPLPREDLAASIRETVVDILIERVELALSHEKYDKLVIAGGVSANSLLRRRAKELCDKYGKQLYIPNLSFCGDNAAMIGSQGYYEYLAGNVAQMDINGYATMPITLE